jgi:hypothetical protein
MKNTLNFLGALAEFQKATSSLVMSVCLFVRPSVLMEQLVSHMTDFHKIGFLRIFGKSVEKIHVSSKSD